MESLSKKEMYNQKKKKKTFHSLKTRGMICSFWDGNCRYTVVSCFHKPVFILIALSVLIKGTVCPFSLSVPPF